jgi:hypothetical protein
MCATHTPKVRYIVFSQLEEKQASFHWNTFFASKNTDVIPQTRMKQLDDYLW